MKLFKKNFFKFGAKKQELTEETARISDVSDSPENSVQHRILNACEQMIDAGRELEEQKKEYRVITQYLNDIQFLESLSEHEKEELRQIAEHIQKIEQTQEQMTRAERKISEAQFLQMRQEENAIPEVIRKLKENEGYQGAINKDIKYLEGEKVQNQYQIQHLIHQQKVLKYSSFILFTLVIFAALSIFAVRNIVRFDVRILWVVLIFLTSILSFLIYIKLTGNEREIRQMEVNRNHAITLINKLKFKYVNVTNAIDYSYEKYHTGNARELEYTWGQYLSEVKEREKFEQLNTDYDYYIAKLMRILSKYELYDKSVWSNQSQALLDKNEMVEIKHKLIERRQKVRNRIEIQNENLRKKRMEMDHMLHRENLYNPEIQGIIESIDNLIGTN